MKTTQYSACVMRDTPGREWSEVSSDNSEKTRRTLSTLVRVDRPYQDAFAHSMADVAEHSEGIQKHVWKSDEVTVMKTSALFTLPDRCLAPKVSAYCQCLGRACCVAEGAKVWGSSIISPKPALRLLSRLLHEHTNHMITRAVRRFASSNFFI